MYARISQTFLLSAKKLRRLCFYMCLSFSPQGGLPQCMLGYHPPRHQANTPPGPGNPLQDQTPPWDQTPSPRADTPGADTIPPPRTRPLRDGCRCGRYASYWNAIVFIEFLLHMFSIFITKLT